MGAAQLQLLNPPPPPKKSGHNVQSHAAWDSVFLGFSGVMGGAQVQALTPTAPKHFGPLQGWGGGAAGLGSQVPQHTYLKMIPSLHKSF